MQSGSAELGVEPIAEPSEQVLNDYRKFAEYVLRPPRALETIATRDVFSCTWAGRLADALRFIDEHGYDDIPIVEGDGSRGSTRSARSSGGSSAVLLEVPPQ